MQPVRYLGTVLYDQQVGSLPGVGVFSPSRCFFPLRLSPGPYVLTCVCGIPFSGVTKARPAHDDSDDDDDDENDDVARYFY